MYIPTRSEIQKLEQDRSRVLQEICDAQNTYRKVQAAHKTALAKLRYSVSTLSKKIEQFTLLRVTPPNEDIMLSILAYFRPISHSPSFHTDMRQLAQCCLISKQWLEPTRKLLYHTCQLPRDNILAVKKYLRTLEENPLTHQVLVRRLVVGDHGSHVISSHLRLFSAITKLDLNLRSKTDFRKYTGLKEIRDLVYRVEGAREADWSGDQWAMVPRRWRYLDSLTFASPVIQLGPGSPQSAFPFTSLRSLRWISTTVTLISLPAIVPHTLHDFSVNDAFGIDARVVRGLIESHFRTLRHIHIASLRDIDLSDIPWSTLLLSATLLKTLHVRCGKTLGTAPGIGVDSLPAVLVDIVVDWPEVTPARAIGFLRERERGPLRSLDVRVRKTWGRIWDEVYNAARNAGIAFSLVAI